MIDGIPITAMIGQKVRANPLKGILPHYHPLSEIPPGVVHEHLKQEILVLGGLGEVYFGLGVEADDGLLRAWVDPVGFYEECVVAGGQGVGG